MYKYSAQQGQAVGEGRREVWMSGGRGGEVHVDGGRVGTVCACGCHTVDSTDKLSVCAMHAAALCLCRCKIFSPPNLLLFYCIPT